MGAIEEARLRLGIPDLWHHFGLPGEPGRCVRSPFREDNNPSFSVWYNGERWKFKDHGTEESGDEIGFFAKADGCDEREASKRFIELAGVDDHSRKTTPKRPRKRAWQLDDAQKTKDRKHWPMLEPSPETLAEDVAGWIEHVAKQRRLQFEGVAMAFDRQLLKFAHVQDWTANTPDNGHPAWIITDGEGYAAQARRMDGLPWDSCGGSKTKNLRGSFASWPVGLSEAIKRSKIVLVEGGPDLLAAHDLISQLGRAHDTGAVAMLGAANKIPSELLSKFSGKQVRIFCHADDSGNKAGERWKEQLAAAGATVDRITFADGSNDLNDHMATDDDLEGMLP